MFLLQLVVTGGRFPVDIFCGLTVLVVSCAEDVNRVLYGALGPGNSEKIAARRRRRLERNETGIDHHLDRFGHRLLLGEKAEQVA